MARATQIPHIGLFASDRQKFFARIGELGRMKARLPKDQAKYQRLVGDAEVFGQKCVGKGKITNAEFVTALTPLKAALAGPVAPSRAGRAGAAGTRSGNTRSRPTEESFTPSPESVPAQGEAASTDDAQLITSEGGSSWGTGTKVLAATAVLGVGAFAAKTYLGL